MNETTGDLQLLTGTMIDSLQSYCNHQINGDMLLLEVLNVYLIILFEQKICAYLWDSFLSSLPDTDSLKMTTTQLSYLLDNALLRYTLSF